MANTLSKLQRQELHKTLDKQGISPSIRDQLARDIFQEAMHSHAQAQNSDLSLDTHLSDTTRRITQNSEANVPVHGIDNPFVRGFILLLLGHQNWWSELRQGNGWTLAKNILVKQDPALFADMHTWVKERLANAHLEVRNPEMREVYLHQLLSFIPFFKPKENEVWGLPFGPEGQLIEYRLERIELTPRLLGSPLMAYGLVAQTPAEAPIDKKLILLLKGTTYPADEGCFFSLLADTNPFSCVGGYAFEFSAKSRLKEWVKNKRTALNDLQAKATVVGASLGGSLALQTACHLAEYVSTTHAFVSPAVTPRDIKRWKKNTGQLQNKPVVNVYLQAGDWISSWVGTDLAEDWHLHRMIAPITGIGQAHAAAFSSHTDAVKIKINSLDEVKRTGRRLWPVVQYFLTIPFFLIGLSLLPLVCLIHNIIRLARYVLKIAP